MAWPFALPRFFAVSGVRREVSARGRRGNPSAGQFSWERSDCSTKSVRSLGRSAAERGVEAAGTGDGCSPVARTGVKKRLCSCECGAKRSSIRWTPQVAGTAGRRDAGPLVDAGGVATSRPCSSRGDCAGATQAGHVRCRGSADLLRVRLLPWGVRSVSPIGWVEAVAVASIGRVSRWWGESGCGVTVSRLFGSVDWRTSRQCCVG